MNTTEFTIGQSLLVVLPELGLAALTFIVLLLDLRWSETQRKNLAVVSGVGLGLLTLLALVIYPGASDSATPVGLYWGGMIRFDALSHIFKVMVLAAGAITSLISADVKGIGRKGEFYIILIVSSLATRTSGGTVTSMPMEAA